MMASWHTHKLSRAVDAKMVLTKHCPALHRVHHGAETDPFGRQACGHIPTPVYYSDSTAPVAIVYQFASVLEETEKERVVKFSYLMEAREMTP